MTLAPSKHLGPRLTFVKDESKLVTYGLGGVCAVPTCQSGDLQTHHIEPRSRTAGPKDFVIIDGVVAPNRCRLCALHHLQVTGGIGGHKGRISWEQGCWWYVEIDRNFEHRLVAPLQGIEGNVPI